MTPEAINHLRRSDPAIRQLIRRIGTCTLQPDPRRTPFESLVRAIAHQQLNGTAAETILNRFLTLFPGKRFPDPEDLDAIGDEPIRAAGFSGAKVAGIRDIAAKTLSGIVPTSRRIARMSDEEIIKRLTECRGVGRWTVEMLLIFNLGRPDVWPVDDFGIREGYRAVYDLEAQPKPKELTTLGERWRPYRTTLAWYLWRAADAAKGTSKAVGQ